MNELLRFRNLSAWPGVVHGVSDRIFPGNISFDFGTLEETAEHREVLRSVIGGKVGGGLTRLVSAQQTHGDRIFVHRKGGVLPDGEIENTDAFVSDVRGTGFLIKTADCQAILMAGRKGTGNKEKSPTVISLVHSGWRGSLKNIVGKTVRKMVEEFGVDPATIEVGVGPSIGPCCAEFLEAEKEFPEWALRYQVDGDGSKRFDFWRMTRDQLMAEGVRDEAIEFCGICTVCHKDRWFSFRGDQPDCGRFGSVIGLQHYAKN